MKARDNLARTVSLCAFLLPAGLLFLLIRRHGVDVPYLEQWNTALLFEKLSAGTLAVADIFEQQNEYRQFFPHLLILALGRLTRWNVKYDLYLILLLACLISLFIYRLGVLTLGGGGRLRAAAAFLLTSLLVFTPMQYENWLYGIQVVYLLPVACVVAGVLVAQTGAGLRAKFILCACLASVATFSAANGMLSWGVLLPPLLLAETRESWKVKRWLAAAWVLLAAASAALYFYDLHPTAGHPSLFDALRHPARGAAFFFTLLGTPLWAGSLWVTVSVGATLAGVYALAVVFLWRQRQDLGLARRMSGWLMLGAFALTSAALVTVGRSGFGLGQAEAGRYIAFTLYLPAAVAHLLPLLASEFGKRGGETRARLVSGFVLFAFVLALAAQARLYPIGMISMMYEGRVHAFEKACTLFVNVLPDECPTARLLPAGLIEERANALDRIGYLRPPLVRSGRLEEMEAKVHDAPGVFEMPRAEGDGSLSVTGSAFLPGGRPADAVLLAYERGEGESIVFALVGPSGERRYSLAQLGRYVTPETDWRGRVPAEKIPRGTRWITAWAFDAGAGKAYRLEGSHDARGGERTEAR